MSRVPTTDGLIDCVHRLTLQKDQLQHDVNLLLAQLHRLKYEKYQLELEKLEEANASLAKQLLLDAKAQADVAEARANFEEARAIRVASEAHAKELRAIADGLEEDRT